MSSRFEDRKNKPFTGVARGFRKRTLATTKLATRLGASAAKTAVKSQFGSRLGLDDYSDNIDKASDTVTGLMETDFESPEAREKAVRQAWELVGEMDQLKGLMMKLGQMMSYLSANMSPEAQRVLASLQADASALDYESIAPVLESELGDKVDALFETFSETAIAAASIGQVHKARYEGQEVAVKVQYPGIEEGLEHDLKMVSAIGPISLIQRRMLGISLNLEELLAELRERILEECDYEQEAVHQIQAREIWKDDATIIIPRVFPQRSSRRVITTEFMEGRNFYEFKENASQEQKNQAAETLYRFTIESVNRYCFFNGDPHPGNYLFRDNGQVVFLDFGCVIKFDKAFIRNWKLMVRAALDEDRSAFRKYTRLVGFVGNEKKFDWDYQWRMYDYIIRPLKQEGPFTFDTAYAKEGDELIVFGNKNKFFINLPRRLLFVNRLQWGLKNILMDLNATINVRDTCLEYFYSPEQEVF